MLELDKIYNMNCLEGMKKIKSKYIPCIVTDPPFAFAGGMSSGMSSLADDQFFYTWLKEVFKELTRVSSDNSIWFIYGDWRAIYLYNKVLKEIQDFQNYSNKKVSQIIVHDRDMIGMGKPFRNQLEFIAFIKSQKSNISRIPNDTPNIIRSYWYYGKHKYHPAEKDIKILKQFIAWGSDKNEIVLDPFIGSGTTAIACKQLQRHYIGFEIEEKYYNIANKRLAQKMIN